MHHVHHVCSHSALRIAGLLTIAGTPAFPTAQPSNIHISKTAGPPAACFQFDIGNMKSLPWRAASSEAGTAEPFALFPTYSEKNLMDDTIQILDGSTDILLHIETLRRAAIYAAHFDGKPSKGREGSVSARLAVFIMNRSLLQIARNGGHAAAWVDAGFALTAIQQMSPGFARLEARGPYFSKATTLAPGDPAVHLACAAGLLENPEGPGWKTHAENAFLLADTGSHVFRSAETFGMHYLGKERMEQLYLLRKQAGVKKGVAK